MVNHETQPAPMPVVLTYDDYLKFPDDGKRYEILTGVAFMTPAPSTTHQSISRDLEFILHTHVRANELGEVFDAPFDVILGRTNVVQPDIVFVSNARLDALSESGMHGPPDLVIEILSDSTAERDLGLKQQLYAHSGVTHYWVVDPAVRTIRELVLKDDAEHYVLHATHGGKSFSPLLFPELEIELAEVFRR